MRRAIFQGAFAPGLHIGRCFDLAHEAGFEGVELSLESSDPLLPEARNESTAAIEAIAESVGLHQPRPGGLRLDSSQTHIEAIRRQADAAGVAITSVSTMQLFFYPLSSPHPAVRARAIATVRSMIEATAQLGGDVVLVAPGMVLQDSPYHEVWQRSQEVLAGLAPEAEAAGVTLAIENVWNKFLLSPLEFCAYIDAFQTPAVAAYFDVANVLRHGLPDQWIELLGRRLRRVHFKDYRLDIDTIQAFTWLLQGDVPWPRVMAALHKIGYQDWIVAEVSPYPGHPTQALHDTARALDQMLSWEQKPLAGAS